MMMLCIKEQTDHSGSDSQDSAFTDYQLRITPINCSPPALTTSSSKTTAAGDTLQVEYIEPRGIWSEWHTQR